jgi:hypothetical protein
MGGAGSVGVTNGVPTAPERLGSGGAGNGGTPGYGGWGGGVLIIEAGGTLTVDGTLSAHGGNANVARAGGGSGGSVWLKAPVIAGHGMIGADGANGNYAGTTVGGGGGGGGRILLAFGRVADLETRAKDAVITETKPDTLVYLGEPTVDGGTGYTIGNPGTVRYLYMPPPKGTLFMVR